MVSWRRFAFIQKWWRFAVSGLDRRMHPASSSPADLALLDEEADAILADAVSSNSARMYAATGGARKNISIIHQQTRCANLAWALKHRGKVKPGDVIVIVGGSFSGMMLAVALALTTDVIVYLIEKDKRLLHRFRDKAHRYLSPVLNSRNLGHGFNALWSDAENPRPIFAWRRDSASGVAAQWMTEWENYASGLPIFTIFGLEITPADITAHAAGVTVRTTALAPHLQPIEANLLIDASGFGQERNDLGLVDHSYWDSGHRLIYDHLVTPAKVLISGCGDSGVIEALHYAIKGFDHSWVEALWRGHQDQIDQGLPAARLAEIFEDGRIDDLDVTSEVGWWLTMHHRMEFNPHTNWLSVEPHYRHFFNAIEAILAPLVVASQGGGAGAVSWADRHALCGDLPDQVQQTIRSALRDLAAGWSSRRIKALADSLMIGPELAVLQSERRHGVKIFLNDLTPTPYTSALSPYNVWLMRLLLALPDVTYVQGPIRKVTQRPDRRFDVAFSDGSSEQYDRVVSRYGAGGRAGLAQPADRLEPPHGSVMLTAPKLRTLHPTKAGQTKVQNAAYDAIKEAARTFKDRKSARRARDISKKYYVDRLLGGANAFPPDHDLFADPQARLADDLRRGRRPTFNMDSVVEEGFRI